MSPKRALSTSITSEPGRRPDRWPLRRPPECLPGTAVGGAGGACWFGGSAWRVDKADPQQRRRAPLLTLAWRGLLGGSVTRCWEGGSIEAPPRGSAFTKRTIRPTERAAFPAQRCAFGEPAAAAAAAATAGPRRRLSSRLMKGTAHSAAAAEAAFAAAATEIGGRRDGRGFSHGESRLSPWLTPPPSTRPSAQRVPPPASMAPRRTGPGCGGCKSARSAGNRGEQPALAGRVRVWARILTRNGGRRGLLSVSEACENGAGRTGSVRCERASARPFGHPK